VKGYEAAAVAEEV